MTDDMQREAFLKWFSKECPITYVRAITGAEEDVARMNFAAKGYEAAIRHKREHEDKA